MNSNTTTRNTTRVVIGKIHKNETLSRMKAKVTHTAKKNKSRAESLRMRMKNDGECQ